MIDARNITQVPAFEDDDQRIAGRLGIKLPELWITERYEERLQRERLSFQVNPDELIRAYDLLEMGEVATQGFGVLFDSLHYDEGADTQREYHEEDFRYPNRIHGSNVPYFTLRADATPTAKEHSAALADFGLLLGSKVMVDLLAASVAEELEHQKHEHANNVKFSGVVAQLVTGVGNIAATAVGVYHAVPYIGGGTGIGVVLAGVGARVVTGIRAKHLEQAQAYEFAEGAEEDHVQTVADQAKIVSFVPDVGGTQVTKGVLDKIKRDLGKL